jgi:hypothetical protein
MGRARRGTREYFSIGNHQEGNDLGDIDAASSRPREIGRRILTMMV